MKAMAQKQISDFFNTTPKKQAKIFKYCISKGNNETEDKEDERICVSGSKETGKQVKKPVGRPKRAKETNEIMEVLHNFHDLYEMVKY